MNPASLLLDGAGKYRTSRDLHLNPVTPVLTAPTTQQVQRSANLKPLQNGSCNKRTALKQTVVATEQRITALMPTNLR